ncbi:MAG: 3-deoxy-D-manno-octulosonic acid transferase [Bacteroidetes bacterium]|nr:3-deoxy-D-manno-octulosonic acid transferase [Bacteroidota bacterium]
MQLTLQHFKRIALYLVFYHIFLLVFKISLWIAAPFNGKAKSWVAGRKGVLKKMRSQINPQDRVIWMHVASLGEFEQGRPLLEQLRITYPSHKILLTFFSPSGYEVQKNYQGADWVFYLPMDGPNTAKRFLDIAHPELVLFVKYEFWFYYLKKISYRKIPLLLIAALFRKDMSFFRWYGAISRKMAARFDHLFVQDKQSLDLLNKIGLGPISSIAGDTRFDRVIEIAKNHATFNAIEIFKGDSQVLVAGSTWPGDEKVIARALENPALSGLKLIIAPHEVNDNHLEELQLLFPTAQLFSSYQLTPNPTTTVLIVDSIGILSSLYSYATFAFVGGGFKLPGIHNTLEAAVYGIPVFFGPHHQRSLEAVELIAIKGAIALQTDEDPGAKLGFYLESLFTDPLQLTKMGNAAYQYVHSKKGATEAIMDFIRKRWSFN